MKFTNVFLILLVFMSGCERRNITESVDSKKGFLGNDRGVKLLEDSSKIDDHFTMFNKSTTPGYGLFVLKDNEIAHLTGYGMADIDEQKQIDENTRFLCHLYGELMIITVLQLAEKKILNLQDPVIEHLPELSGIYDSALTMDYLLKGMGGFPDFEKRSDEKEQWTVDEIVELYSTWDAPRHKPGEGLPWGNFVASVLFDKIIYEITNKHLQQYFVEDIFIPLEMENTGFLKPGENEDIKYYKRRSMQFLPLERETLIVKELNELYTTLNDMAKFYKALDSGNLLNKESLDYYYEPYKYEDGSDVIDTNNAYKKYFTGYFSLGAYICKRHHSDKLEYYSQSWSERVGGAYLPQDGIRVFMFSNVPDADSVTQSYNILSIMGLTK